jgi:hypothetical protein
VALGETQIDLRYRKTGEEITLEVTKTSTENLTSNFEPALSLRARVVGVEMNGRRAEFHVTANEVDQHVLLHLPITGKSNTIRIRVRNDFALAYEAKLPMLGEASQGLRILSETWSVTRDTLTVEVSGRPGVEYELAVWKPREVRGVGGAKLVESDRGTVARFQLTGEGAGSFLDRKIVFHF